MRQLPKTASNFAVDAMVNKYNFAFEISILMEKEEEENNDGDDEDDGRVKKYIKHTLLNVYNCLDGRFQHIFSVVTNTETKTPNTLCRTI